MKASIILIILIFANLCLNALNPASIYKQDPGKFNMVYDEHKVETADGAILLAWYFPNQVKTTKLILLSHNGEGNMADYLRKVDTFLSLGYNVVIYDYRGFGGSSAFAIDNDMFIYPHFQDDLIAMITYCAMKFNAMINLYGWGIGAGLSLGIGYHRPEIKRIIADTPFLSMEDLEIRFAKWDTPMEVPFAGYNKKYEPLFALDLAPAKNLEKIMLIIGNNDNLFKPEDMKLLQKKKPKLVSVILEIKNPDRLDNFTADKTTYKEAISKFLNE